MMTHIIISLDLRPIQIICFKSDSIAAAIQIAYITKIFPLSHNLYIFVFYYHSLHIRNYNVRLIIIDKLRSDPDIFL